MNKVDVLRSYVLPVRVVWVSGDSRQCTVKEPQMLLAKRFGQVPEGTFLAGSGCRMENMGKPASVLVDFGRELHGGVQLACGGPTTKGMQVRVRFGESVAEAMAELGERGACNDHAIRDSVIDLPWAGTREIGNTGFRFVRVDLVTEGILSLESLRAISVMRPMAQLGSFRCSDKRLTQIWDTAARTVHLCCQDFLWDGIKRDRLVWMGDMHPEMMSVLAVFGNQPVLRDSLDYMRKITSATEWMNRMPSYTLWWIRCQHDLHLYSGDTEYLRTQHPYIKKVFTHLVKYISKDGRCTLPSGFLDWPTQHNRPAVDAGMQALMLMTFADGARLAEVLGDNRLAGVCQRGATSLRQYVPAPAESKQAAAMLALSGLRSARDMHDAVLAVGGAKGFSTFYGYYMLEAMAEASEIQHGMRMVRDYWGGMLDMGATSFWEDFDLDWMQDAFRIDELPVPGKRDIHGDFGQFCYKGFRHSLCHGWASGPAPWLSAHVLGIQILQAGCRKVRINPVLGKLKWAEGTYPTPMGVIKVRHEKSKNGTIHSEVSLPKGCRSA